MIGDSEAELHPGLSLSELLDANSLRADDGYAYFVDGRQALRERVLAIMWPTGLLAVMAYAAFITAIMLRAHARGYLNVVGPLSAAITAVALTCLYLQYRRQVRVSLPTMCRVRLKRGDAPGLDKWPESTPLVPITSIVVLADGSGLAAVHSSKGVRLRSIGGRLDIYCSRKGRIARAVLTVDGHAIRLAASGNYRNAAEQLRRS